MFLFNLYKMIWQSLTTFKKRVWWWNMKAKMKCSFRAFILHFTYIYDFLTVETCDHRSIPLVDHGSYALQCFDAEETEIPPLGRQNFTIPRQVNVTYSCDKGYRLQDPNTNLIGCEYVTKRRTRSETKSDDVTAEALWTSTLGIACIKSETTLNKNQRKFLYSLPKLSTKWFIIFI